MTKEEDIAKNLSLIEYYKEQLDSINMQIQFVQAAISDYLKAKVTVDQLTKIEDGTDILIPISPDIFVNASAKNTSKTLVGVGAGVIIEKTTDEAIKKLDDRIKSLQESQKKLLSMAQQIESEAIELSNKTQAMMSESGK